jgi:hypothetical protein
MSRTKTNRPLHEEEAKKASFSILSHYVSAFLNIIFKQDNDSGRYLFRYDEGTMYGESCSQYIRILIVYKTGRRGTPLVQEINECHRMQL